MSAHLYDSILIGPIHSRRLGTSLGINLLPLTTKFCTFECIYCECGDTPRGAVGRFEETKEVVNLLEKKIIELKTSNSPLDSITFSGNGEPTMHPDFLNIIKEVVRLRDQYYPQCKVSVLSNATQLHLPNVVEALKKIDNRILKVDGGLNETINRIDQPIPTHFCLESLTEQLLQFDGDFIMQTIFLRGTIDGEAIDNTLPNEIEAWYKIVEKTHPKQIMVYTIDRDTPIQTLEKVSIAEMERIAEPLRKKGYDVMVAG